MMNKDNPHFSPQELREIYAAAEEKTQAGLLGAARALFPERADALKTLYLFPGGGRAFRDSAGTCRKPVFTVQSWPNEVAVMEDGTLLDY